jgi:outer membrane protein insertion porin family
MRSPYRTHELTLWAVALLAVMSVGAVAQGQAIDDEDRRYFEQVEADRQAREAERAEPLENPYSPEENAEVGVRLPRTLCDGRKIRRIEFVGNRRVEADDALAKSRLRVGAPCIDEDISGAARRLWEMDFFDDLVFEAEPVGQYEVDIRITVKERPVIGEIKFEGNDDVSDEDIEKALTLKQGEILSMPKLRSQITKIRDVFAEEGYFLAEVELSLGQVKEERGEVDVTFKIQEGPAVKVRRIRFIGNSVLSSGELAGVMKTSQTGFFSFITSSNELNRQAFDEDVMRLQAYYYDKGFLSMSVGQPRIELTPDQRYVDITIPVEEGPRFKIGKVRVRELGDDGRPVEPLGGEKKLLDLMDVEEGAYFSRTTIAMGLQAVTRTYRNEGYARVETEPQTDLDPETRIVNLDIEIKRGPIVYIERIEVKGNTKTRDRVIRREMLILEGDQYHETKLESSKGRITALGYFERVDFSESAGSTPDAIKINVEVTEKATGTFQVGAGFSSLESFLLTSQIMQQNLFGHGQTLAFNLQLSGIRQFYQISFIEPWLFNSMWSFSFDAYRTTHQYDLFNRQTTGTQLLVGHPIHDRRLRVRLGYQLERINVSERTQGFGNQSVPGAFFVPDAALRNRFRDGRTSLVTLGVNWDSRNNRIFPSHGWFLDYSVRVADKFLGSENVYVRQDAFVRFYRKLFGPVIFKANVTGGLITSRQDIGVPISERYYLGGINTIRGFFPFTIGPRILIPSRADPNRIAPMRGQTIGGNLMAYYQVELEFPLLESVGIRGVIFTDGGNSWNLEESLCQGASINVEVASECGIHGIRTSAGFGFRWFSPLGPLRFEWGFPIKRHKEFGEKPVRFEFNIGTSF